MQFICYSYIVAITTFGMICMGLHVLEDVMNHMEDSNGLYVLECTYGNALLVTHYTLPMVKMNLSYCL
jgi:membrane-bound metal-dependent hydrolase YbcI (DUF457 family)